MYEQMPPMAKRETPKKVEGREKQGFLTEYLKGARKYIATGLGAMILLLSAESLAKGKPGQTEAEDAFYELDKNVEAAEKAKRNVAGISILELFYDALDRLQVDSVAKEKIRKALDETLEKIDADTKLTKAEKHQEKLKAIYEFRRQLEARLDAQASKAKPEAGPEVAPAAATAESEVKVESRKGAVVVEGETQTGSFDSYVRDGVLSPDFDSKIPDKAKFGIGRTTLLGRLAVLKMRIDAAKQAEAAGQKEKAVSLRDAVKKQREIIERTYGDILR